jgi:hypothetical protein
MAGFKFSGPIDRREQNRIPGESPIRPRFVRIPFERRAGVFLAPDRRQGFIHFGAAPA